MWTAARTKFHITRIANQSKNVSLFIKNKAEIYESTIVKSIVARAMKHTPWKVQACVEACACDRTPSITRTACRNVWFVYRKLRTWPSTQSYQFWVLRVSYEFWASFLGSHNRLHVYYLCPCESFKTNLKRFWCLYITCKYFQSKMILEKRKILWKFAMDSFPCTGVS